MTGKIGRYQYIARVTRSGMTCLLGAVGERVGAFYSQITIYLSVSLQPIEFSLAYLFSVYLSTHLPHSTLSPDLSIISIYLSTSLHPCLIYIYIYTYVRIYSLYLNLSE